MLKEDFLVSLPESTMQHDFAMTEDYVIFLDFPLIGNPEACPRSLHVAHGFSLVIAGLSYRGQAIASHRFPLH